MPIALYMDVHIPRAITLGLRMRKIDVLTAQEDGMDRAADHELLNRATHLSRGLFTFDDDLVVEAGNRQRENKSFSGLIFAHPLRTSIGKCVQDLEIISKVTEPADLCNQVVFLPL